MVVMSPWPPARSEDYSKGYKAWVLGLLLIIYMVNYIDRSILNTVGQAAKVDLGLSDLQLGLLGGAAFALFNGAMSIPIARLAERNSRVAILSLALAFWSAMTVLCGMAQTVLQLTLARIGVGIGEAGGSAPSQSLISDYFPAEKRSTAISIYALGVPVGILLGAIGSGWLTEMLSWRAAFIAVGAPGLALALVTFFTLKEPRRGHSDPGAVIPDQAPPLSAVIKRLFASRTLVHLLAGATLVNFAAAGLLQFLHPMLVRSFGLGYAEAATLYGVVVGISAGIGFLSGGMLTDRFGRRDARAYAIIPGVCLLLAAPIYGLGLNMADWRLAAGGILVGGILVSTYFGPTFAVAQNLVEPRMRATAVAVLAFVINVVGTAAGGIFVGALSDVFANGAGGLPAAGSAGGLRMALTLDALIFAWAGVHFLLAGRSIRQDLG